MPVRRVLLLLLPAAGLAVSVYLTLYQLDVLGSVWDPLFDSPKVLGLTEPVPDAAAGALAYGAETALWFAGRRTWALLLLGALFAAGAVTSLVLIAVQAFVADAWCLLCLVSAAISLALPLIGAREARATRRAPRAPRPATRR